MLHAGGKDQTGLSILSQLHDLLTGRADNLLAVHQVFNFAGDELAATHMQSAGVDLVLAGLGHERAQESVADQLFDADLVADGIEEVLGCADRSGVQSEWRRGQSDHADVRIDDLRLCQELPIHAIAVGGDQMGLIDDYQVERAQVTGPLVDRLDAGHDHCLAHVAAV